MANIMLTDACNLQCPYCFANEFVNIKKNEITEEAFDYAVNFIVGNNGYSSVGLIGGEPTIHSKFEYLVRKLIVDNRVKEIVVYTNGINIDKYWDVLTHKKVHMLINCNHPDDIGKDKFEKICSNLEILLDKKMFRDNTTLGINIYKTDFNYEYIIELLEKYEFDHVRVSLTVPNMESDRNKDAHEYFRVMKPRLLCFFKDLLEKEIVPYFDCNKIPSCLISEEDIKIFGKYLENPELKQKIMNSNISNRRVECRPVIDIRQDLFAVRCFGLSESTKQNIREFESIRDLEGYYLRTVDAYAYNTVYSSQCMDCYSRKVLQCSGGCLAFKINEINRIKNWVEREIK